MENVDTETIDIAVTFLEKHNKIFSWEVLPFKLTKIRRKSKNSS